MRGLWFCQPASAADGRLLLGLRERAVLLAEDAGVPARPGGGVRAAFRARRALGVGSGLWRRLLSGVTGRRRGCGYGGRDLRGTTLYRVGPKSSYRAGGAVGRATAAAGTLRC